MHTLLRNIPDGAAGTDCTVNSIKKLVISSLRSQSLRLRALELLRGFRVDSHAPSEAAKALFHWVRSNIRYVNDPVGLETVQSPEITLQVKAGDCDDHAGLMAALAMSIGIPARIVVIGPDPDNFQHVFAELLTDGVWQPADTTRSVAYGSPAPELGAKKIYEFSESEGLGNMTGYESLPTSVDSMELESAVRDNVHATLTVAWAAGKINRADVVNAISAIDTGSAPFEQDVWLKQVIRSASNDFLTLVDQKGYVSSKPSTSGIGILGISFLDDIWKGVKSVVGWLFSGKSYTGNTITLPTIQEAPKTFSSSLNDFFTQNTGLVLVGGALLAYLLLRKS